jgi:hypothetical protein
MMKARKLNIILALLALTFGFSSSVKAQVDCVYGFRIYARDEAGKAIEGAKIEVKGLSERDKLPANVNPYVEKSGAYNIHAFGGQTLKGDFILKVSAAGYEVYERRFNFPVCEMQSFELSLRSAGSTEKANFERLLTVHGKVYDDWMKPFGGARIEATLADGRVYRTSSNAYGYYEIDLPRGVAKFLVTDKRIPNIIFENFKVEEKNTVLNMPVCIKCKGVVVQNH